MNAPENLLAFDPGKRTGWAWFRWGKLSRAGYSKFGELIADPPRPTERSLLLVVIETPQWRPREHLDINDLLELAVMAGRLEQTYVERQAHVERVLPTTWKGSVPKEHHHPHVVKCLAPDEVLVMPLRPRAKDHDPNMLDAVGLGLWKLGRMGR